MCHLCESTYVELMGSETWPSGNAPAVRAERERKLERLHPDPEGVYFTVAFLGMRGVVNHHTWRVHLPPGPDPEWPTLLEMGQLLNLLLGKTGAPVLHHETARIGEDEDRSYVAVVYPDGEVEMGKNITRDAGIDPGTEITLVLAGRDALEILLADFASRVSMPVYLN